MFIYKYYKKLLSLTFISLIIISFPIKSIQATVTFQNKYITHNKVLKLSGTGLLYYLIVIKAYTGAFYIEEGEDSKNALENVAKRLVLEYFHAIEAEDFARSTTAMIEKNVSGKSFLNLKESINKFNSFYKNVKPGDRYAITYVPGKGTTLTLNEQALGTIKGYDFSYAVFSIWLGKNPIDKKMKADLLGK